MQRMDYDAVVIGGGPAGLSAALYLGRSRRRTLVVDAGQPRNARTHAAHGVFTRDGTPPRELLGEARRQLETYPSVAFRSTEAIGAQCMVDGVEVHLREGGTVSARRLIFACGVRDKLPSIEGLAEHWGSRVHSCTYCDGYENADQPLAAFAKGNSAVKTAASLLQLSEDVVICSDGTPGLSGDERRLLERHGARVVEARIRKVSAACGGVAIHLDDGSVIVRSAIFLDPTPQIASDLPKQLGCNADGASLIVDKSWQTTVPRVYAAGDIATARKFVAAAAASGAEAAMCLDRALTQQDFA